MKFRTEIDIARAEQGIGYNDRMALLGSCFSDNIAAKLREYYFPITANPTGTLYNPVSVARHLDDVAEANIIFITFGTAWVYEDVATGEVVDNCQKRPASDFIRRRMTVNERIDERTLREIYLAAFEGAVKQASPWTVMCSYNRINGYHSSQNKWLLTDVLRNDWGYDGLVMSDWGAVDDRVEGIKAGLDLELFDHWDDTTRKVQTLSGGESFLAALALALGLAEEVQSSKGGVQLDSMFVDEGFGTLDEESLDLVMNALSELSNDSSRLIGIISHVDELKNRIDNQITITKDVIKGSTATVSC